MVTFICDNRRTEKLLEKLARQVVDAGGWLDPEMKIQCEDGNLSLLSGLQTDSGDTLISVPEAALLPVEQGEFYLSGDSLCIRPSEPGLSHERSRLLDTMLEIYDATGKIAAHRTTSPWLAFAGAPQILRMLRQDPDSGIQGCRRPKVRSGHHAGHRFYQSPPTKPWIPDRIGPVGSEADRGAEVHSC
jgi:hypothetical protein